MKVSARGLAFIEAEEGFRPEPYNDSRGNATQGIGHLLHFGPVNDADRAAEPWTREQAMARLAADLEPIEEWLDGLLSALGAWEQYYPDWCDALASWAFNIGITRARQSTLAAALAMVKPDVVPVELMRWCSPGKPDSGALLNRRRREAYLWLRGHDGVPRR